MKSIFEKWDTANPVTGERRYAVRYWDDRIDPMGGADESGSAISISAMRDQRDKWFSYLQKKERKMTGIAGLH